MKKNSKKNKYAGACYKCISCVDYENGICTLTNVRINEMPYRKYHANVCIAYQPRGVTRNE